MKDYHPDFKRIEPYYNKLLDINYSILMTEMANGIRYANMIPTYDDSFLGDFDGSNPATTPQKNGQQFIEGGDQ